MATITPHKRAKDTVWRSSFYYVKDGKNLRHTSIIPVEDKKIAQRMANDLEATFKSVGLNNQDTLGQEWWKNQADGMMKAWGLKPVFSSEHTIATVGRAWLLESKAKKATRNAYSRHLRFIEEQGVSAKPILAASVVDCEGLLRAFGEGRAKGTVKVFKSTLQGIFAYALKHDYISKNVTKGLSLKDFADGGFERKMFSIEDVKKLRAFFENPSPVGDVTLEEIEEWRGMMEVALRGAIRLQDTSRITSDDLTLKGDILYLRYRAEKTDKEVSLPCSDLFRSLVEGTDGQLFPLLSEMIVRGRSGLSARWILVQEAAGVSKEAQETANGSMVSTKSFHSWRHTAPSWMVSAGVSEEDIRAITGHSGRILNEVYLHRIEEEQPRNKAKVDKWEKSHGL